MLAELLHRVHHLDVVTHFASDLFDIVKPLCVGLGSGRVEVFQIFERNRCFTGENLRYADPHPCLVAIRFRKALRQSLIFHLRVGILFGVEPLPAAIQLLQSGRVRKIFAEIAFQPYHGIPRVSSNIGVGSAVINLHVRECGLQLFALRFIRHREGKIPVGLRQQLVIGLQDLQRLGIRRGNMPVKQRARGCEADFAGEGRRSDRIAPVHGQIADRAVEITGLEAPMSPGSKRCSR